MNSRFALAVSLTVALFAVACCHGEVTPSEVLDAVDKMTPEQALEFTQKLESRLWDPLPYGFFSSMAVMVGPSIHEIDSIEVPPGVGGAADARPDGAAGQEVSIIWRCMGEQTLVGLRFATLAGDESRTAGGGYQRTEILSGSVAVALHQQLVRSESWLLWVDVSGGYAGLEMEEVVTPAEGGSTVRYYDGGYAFGEVRGGATWRINPILGIYASGGYRFADDVSLDEGDIESGIDLDHSGACFQLGLAVNL